MYTDIYDFVINADGTLVTDYDLVISRYDGDGQSLNRCCAAKNVHRKSGRYITRTNSGEVVAGSEDCSKLAVMSKDLTLKWSLTPTSTYCEGLKCNPLDDTLAVMEGDSFLLLPREAYLPPFSLTTLCVSAVLQHADVLLVACLPPGIHRLFNNLL